MSCILVDVKRSKILISCCNDNSVYSLLPSLKIWRLCCCRQLVHSGNCEIVFYIVGHLIRYYKDCDTTFDLFYLGSNYPYFICKINVSICPYLCDFSLMCTKSTKNTILKGFIFLNFNKKLPNKSKKANKCCIWWPSFICYGLYSKTIILQLIFAASNQEQPLIERDH